MSACEATVAVIEPVIDHSLSLLARRATRGDTANGLVAALRRTRELLEEAGGYSIVTTLDEAIRDRLIIRDLRRRRAGETREAARLPPPRATALLAETCLLDAVENCVVMVSGQSEASGMILIMLVLLDRLIEVLGEAPSHTDLLGWLRRDEMLGDERVPETAASAWLH